MTRACNESGKLGAKLSHRANKIKNARPKASVALRPEPVSGQATKQEPTTAAVKGRSQWRCRAVRDSDSTATELFFFRAGNNDCVRNAKEEIRRVRADVERPKRCGPFMIGGST